MSSFLVKLAVNAVALWVATLVVQGVTLAPGSSTSQKIVTVLLVALIFGLVNAIIKPVVKLFALPLYILTLGLITFVINAFMLLLTSWISTQTGLTFHVEDFGTALLAALVVTFVSFVLNVVLPDGK